MTLDQLIVLLKAVMLTPEVIGVTIVIVFYINIVNYIVSYRKQAPKPKKGRKPKAVPESTAPTAAERAGNASPPDDEEEAEKEAAPKAKAKGK